MAIEDMPAEFEEQEDVEFRRIRKAMVIYLQDLKDNDLDGGPKLNVIRDAVGGEAWRIMTPEQRMFALGRGCPGLDYSRSKEVVELNWEDHPSEVRKDMAANLLNWLRDEED